MYMCDIDVRERFETGELFVTLSLGVLKIHLKLDQAAQLHLLHALIDSRQDRRAYIPAEIYCPPLPSRGKDYIDLTEDSLAVRKLDMD